MCAASVIYDMFGHMPDSWYNQERIALFKRMTIDAAIFDVESNQPDCVDQEKAKVFDRIIKLEQNFNKE